MRNGIGIISAPSLDVEQTLADLPGGETQTGLLARLQHQNSALEKLRRALDFDDDEAGSYPSIRSERSGS